MNAKESWPCIGTFQKAGKPLPLLLAEKSGNDVAAIQGVKNDHPDGWLLEDSDGLGGMRLGCEPALEGPQEVFAAVVISDSQTGRHSPGQRVHGCLEMRVIFRQSFQPRDVTGEESGIRRGCGNLLDGFAKVLIGREPEVRLQPVRRHVGVREQRPVNLGGWTAWDGYPGDEESRRFDRRINLDALAGG